MDSAITILREKARTRQFLTFVYTKKDGSSSTRQVQIGFDIGEKFAKEGQELKGTGSWMSSHRQEKNGWLIERNGKTYINASEINGDKKTPKVFELALMSNLR